MKKQILVSIIITIVLATQINAANCIYEIESTKTADFYTEMPDFNNKLSGGTCDTKIPVFKNKEFLIKVDDGGFTVNIKNKMMNSFDTEMTESPDYIVSMSECAFDTFLRADNKGGVFAYLYLEDEITLEPVGFGNKFGFFFIKIVLKTLLKKAQVPVDIACT